MVRTALFLMGLTIALPAAAVNLQVYTESDGITPVWLLEPQPGSFYENGIGAPTVTYDDVTSTYVMLFETRLPDSYIATLPGDYTGCGSIWAFGRATSPDGLNWSVTGTDPVVIPQPGSYFGCMVGHPNVVRDNGTLHLWFKADDATGQRGVGYATSTDEGLTWTYSTDPVIQITGFGFPTVAKVDDTWYMLLAKVPSLHLATSQSPDKDWAMLSTPVFDPGRAQWMEDRVYGPSLTCEPAGATYALTAHFGGKDCAVGDGACNPPNASGLGRAWSNDGVTWWLDTSASPAFQWVGDQVWNHWSILRAGSDYLVWFTQKNSAGQNRIGFATTNFSWADADVASRICTAVVDTGDTGSGTDTGTETETETASDTGTDSSTGSDSTTDTDTGTGSDTDTGEIGGGCCSTTGGTALGFGWVALLGAIALGRRRRA